MIDVNKINEKDGLPLKDKLRDGMSSDLDGLLVAALLQKMIDTINYQEKRIEDLEEIVATNMGKLKPLKRGRKKLEKMTV